MPPFHDAFSFALAAVLDYVACGGANEAECFDAAAQVRSGDYESWHLAWVGLAERVRREAGRAFTGRRKNEARDAFLRAAQYYHTAGRFLNRAPGDDARSATTAQASAACFATAMRLSSPPAHAHDVEHAGTRHTAYRFPASSQSTSAVSPTLLACGDGETAALPLYFACAVPAHRCGWDCLAVPGGGGAVGLVPLLNAARVAVVFFAEETVLPRRHRLLPLVTGNMEEANAALQHHASHGAAADAGYLTFASLDALHRNLSGWLGGIGSADGEPG